MLERVAIAVVAPKVGTGRGSDRDGSAAADQCSGTRSAEKEVVLLTDASSLWRLTGGRDDLESQVLNAAGRSCGCLSSSNADAGRHHKSGKHDESGATFRQ